MAMSFQLLHICIHFLDQVFDPIALIISCTLLYKSICFIVIVNYTITYLDIRLDY